METFYWTTENYHADNNITMSDYLEHHLPIEFNILLEDGTYAEVEKDGIKYAVHASGNGDSYNHKVEFEQL